MPIISSLWNRIKGQGRVPPVGTVCHRFTQAFVEHGIEVAQIPRLIPQVTLADLNDPQRLLAALTPAVLDQAAKLFGIRVEWLEGKDDQIYDYLGCSKQPEIILEHIATVLKGQKDRFTFPLRILCTTRKLDPKSGGRQELIPVVVEKIAELGEDSIYRYHVYCDGFDWEYEPCRIELKTIARIVFSRLRTVVPLFVISEKQMDELLEGRLIPWRYLKGCQITAPSLEDFALSKEDDVAAQEVDELPEVLRYIEKHGLQDFTFERPSQPEEASSEIATESSATPETTAPLARNPGKRARAQTELWEPARNAALAIWSRDPTMPIADVIRQIQMIPQLKAAKRGESAIRKHIADLAPEGVAGKPGRKPKKST